MKIEILDEQVGPVVIALRDRIKQLGETYAHSESEDREIGALKQVAKALGYTIDATTRAGGFDVQVSKNEAK